MFVKLKSQNIDRLIQGIKTIQLNRCSLSDEDLKLLEEAVTVLKKHKSKWSKNDAATLLVIIKAAELISKFLGH